MSLTEVRPYFRTRLESLNFHEWTDGFNFEEIPESIIDRAYHLTVGSLGLIEVNHTINKIAYPILLRVYLKGFRDPASAIDDAISEGEDIICEVTKITNATQQGIKDVVFGSFEPIPKSETNDNIVLLDFSFTANVILDRR